MNSSPPIDAEPMTHVVEAFAEWRAVRRAREPTPERLQRLAAALLADHRAFHICEALRINATALKQWAANLPEAHIQSTRTRRTNLRANRVRDVPGYTQVAV